MLRTFHEKLEQDVKDQEGVLKEFLAKTLPEGASHEPFDAIRDYILAMPASISIFSSLVLSDKTPIEVRAFYGMIMAYVMDAEDLLPETEYGFYGQLDDAYLVHSALERSIAVMGDKAKETIPDLEKLQPLFAMRHFVKNFLPKDVLMKLNNILLHFDKTLEKVRV